MDEAGRLLTLLALTGAAFASVGGVIAWFLDETRRLRRTLIQALGGEPQPILIARGRGFAACAARMAPQHKKMTPGPTASGGGYRSTNRQTRGRVGASLPPTVSLPLR